MPPGSTIAFVATALLKPWAFDRQVARFPRGSPIWLAVIFTISAALLSTLLSTWTYLIGKGLILAAGEMDMGRDDLPADTIGQVVAAFLGSIATWLLLLGLAVLVCLAVADLLYAQDRASWRLAAQRTGALTIWFVVWAILVLGLNAARQDEMRHPAAAIRTSPSPRAS